MNSKPRTIKGLEMFLYSWMKEPLTYLEKCLLRLYNKGQIRSHVDCWRFYWDEWTTDPIQKSYFLFVLAGILVFNLLITVIKNNHYLFSILRNINFDFWRNCKFHYGEGKWAYYEEGSNSPAVRVKEAGDEWRNLSKFTLGHWIYPRSIRKELFSIA